MNISRYVEQLTEDVEYLLKKTPPYELSSEPGDIFEAGIEFEEHVMNEVGVWVCDYSGIFTDQIPEAGLLSEGQVNLLLSSLLMLLDHYNFHPVFPEALPDRERYSSLRQHWHKFKAPLGRYDYYYEFCYYIEEECPFPEYCNGCSEIQEEIEFRDEAEGS